MFEMGEDFPEQCRLFVQGDFFNWASLEFEVLAGK